VIGQATMEQRTNMINSKDSPVKVTIANGQSSAMALYLSGEEVATQTGTTANFVLEGLSEGAHVVEVVATNAAGDRQRASQDLVVDLTPLYLALLSPYNGQVVYRSISDGVQITGLSEPGAIVTVGSATVTVGDDGRFTQIVKVTQAGQLSIPISAVDLAGNRSDPVFVQVMALEQPVRGVGSEPDNADLAGLTIGQGILTPDFQSQSDNYTVTLEDTVTQLTIRPTLFAPLANVTVDGQPVQSGVDHTAMLPAGISERVMTIEVMSEDKSVRRAYTLRVVRPLSTNAQLAELSLTTGALTPGFVPGTTDYSSSVADDVDRLRVIALAGQSAATITVNGTPLGSGTASPSILLAVGTNMVSVAVTASDGTTQNTYTIRVTRAAPVTKPVLPETDKDPSPPRPPAQPTPPATWVPRVPPDVVSHWVEESIRRLGTAGVVPVEENFRPDEAVTRAEFAKLMALALRLRIRPDEPLPLADANRIPEPDRPYIAAALRAGLIVGFEDGNFRPDAPITRAEIAVILNRGLRIKGAESSFAPRLFTDADAVPGWARSAVGAASAAGLITGFADGSFRPAELTTRANAAMMILRLMNR